MESIEVIGAGFRGPDAAFLPSYLEDFAVDALGIVKTAGSETRLIF